MGVGLRFGNVGGIVAAAAPPVAGAVPEILVGALLADIQAAGAVPGAAGVHCQRVHTAHPAQRDSGGVQQQAVCWRGWPGYTAEVAIPEWVPHAANYAGERGI